MASPPRPPPSSISGLSSLACSRRQSKARPQALAQACATARATTPFVQASAPQHRRIGRPQRVTWIGSFATSAPSPPVDIEEREPHGVRDESLHCRVSFFCVEGRLAVGRSQRAHDDQCGDAHSDSLNPMIRHRGRKFAGLTPAVRSAFRAPQTARRPAFRLAHHGYLAQCVGLRTNRTAMSNVTARASSSASTVVRST